MIDSPAALLGVLRDNRLLDTEQLEDLDRLVQQGRWDLQPLAQELVRRGWLTTYQVEEIFQGRAMDLVTGPYHILDRVGQSAVSEVFKARQSGLRSLVALKVIRPEFLANPETSARFQREIEAACRLAHPNIVKVLDVDPIRDKHYFAMEYLEGIDLDRLVFRDGPPPIATACDYTRQAALGLQHIHENGLVHRDIKPANLFLAAQGTVVKILDLGLARLPRQQGELSSSHWTKEGALIGTPDYLAPEQARNARSADRRADIYGLGCTLYFLLTGQPPFPGNALMQKLLDHQHKEPTPVESLRLEVVPDLAAVVHKAMAKDRAARYQTAAELAAALVPFCPGDPLHCTRNT